MKDLLRKIKLREKTITAACRTPDGIEWTTFKVNTDGRELVEQSSMPLELPAGLADEALAERDLPDDVSEHVRGEVTVALRASELLTRTMVFPTGDENEVAEMIGFQMDKISPFPIDQLAMSHEILLKNEDSSEVLMAAAKRARIDAIGEMFEKKGVRIHSIDARVLGWIQLLRDADHLADSGCEILIIVDGVDFVLAVLNEGRPITFRSLPARLDDMSVIDELTHEIAYTLTTLDAEHELPAPKSFQFWSLGEVPAPLRSKLAEKCGVKVDYHDLADLPPLSEGMARRTLSEENHIELIPAEWIEHMKRQTLNKRFSIIAGGVAVVWVIVLLGFFSVFKARDMKLNAVRGDANAIAPMARQAEANQRKLKALRVYTDRSDSSLECLREVTRVLPVGDIEFVSYGYDKNKGVTLRGTGRDKSIVTDFFATLNKSDLFDGIRNESVNEKVTKGVRRAIFSVSLPLAEKEESK